MSSGGRNSRPRDLSLGWVLWFWALCAVQSLFAGAAVLSRGTRCGHFATLPWVRVAVIVVMCVLPAWYIVPRVRGRHSPTAPRMGWGKAMFLWPLLAVLGCGCLLDIAQTIREACR
ncbi:hypothetical protein GobsT_61810 [Gemmata obscuriglobus]|uniref:Uncharacterized protein n=1 Tax=Gemmata obscuriglobus TaxID=114 RepID=A0A2Z3GQF7_9BACT|nr:hypothetical protein C1280_02925 [Gemmata obscuriglobus]QEG31360.1 hypothetical protein GobsT_61810 [Gemmata obscuriglobus]VTS10700.1 unnamed protein product [Gemmata obscuriglobus UQM 2246]